MAYGNGAIWDGSVDGGGTIYFELEVEQSPRESAVVRLDLTGGHGAEDIAQYLAKEWNKNPVPGTCAHCTGPLVGFFDESGKEGLIVRNMYVTNHAGRRERLPSPGQGRVEVIQGRVRVENVRVGVRPL